MDFIKNKSALLVLASAVIFLTVAIHFVYAAPSIDRQAVLNARIDFLKAHIAAAQNTKDLYQQEIKNIDNNIFEWSHEIEGHEYELTDQTSGK